MICDKPLTATLPEAEALADTVAHTGTPSVLTHTYTGYPLIRLAREIVARGDLGRIRVAQAEYALDWLTEPLEATGRKQATWRTNPARSGAGGAIGDIGTHASHPVEFVTGLRTEQLSADLSSFVDGRQLDDNAPILLRFDGGAKGMLRASQVAPGHENGLRLRVYGEKASLVWPQENPNRLRFARLGEAPCWLTRAGPGAEGHGTRIPAGHPEGYLEAFATLYAEAAALIRQAEPTPLLPGIEEGMRGMRVVASCVASAHGGSRRVAV